MAACSLPVQSQCYLLNSSPVSTIDRYEICEQKLRAYLGNAADYTRLTITDDMCYISSGNSTSCLSPINHPHKMFIYILHAGTEASYVF